MCKELAKRKIHHVDVTCDPRRPKEAKKKAPKSRGRSGSKTPKRDAPKEVRPKIKNNTKTNQT